MKPIPHKTTWHVFTTSDLYVGLHMGDSVGSWSWVVHGPRGSDTGVENTASIALDKAMAAAELLRDPKETRR